MVLTGQNFTSDSKVIFSEKTQGEEYVFLITNVFGGMNLLRSSLKATVEEPPKDCIGSL